MMADHDWKEESRYYNPRCTNELKPASGQNACPACIIPVQVNPSLNQTLGAMTLTSTATIV